MQTDQSKIKYGKSPNVHLQRPSPVLTLRQRCEFRSWKTKLHTRSRQPDAICSRNLFGFGIGIYSDRNPSLADGCYTFRIMTVSVANERSKARGINPSFSRTNYRYYTVPRWR